jgi:NAD(P)-dependent dehydrogenase (short-subunit alcohol dehydrogenase family)
MMDKVVIVTGGGRGIGRATARLAAARGYAVCIAYVSDTAAAEAVRQEIEAKGGRAIAVKTDVAREADVVALFAAADALGPLHGLVNCAGVLPDPDRVENITPERLRRVFDTNVTGSFLCAREAIRRLSTRHGGPGGAIVNISSAAAHLGGAGSEVDYAASKAAIEVFTLGLAREVAAEGIRVNAVRPGPTRTAMIDNPKQPGRVQLMAEIVPMKRVGEPEEIAAPVLWLLSDEASFVTGTTIVATGGR